MFRILTATLALTLCIASSSPALAQFKLERSITVTGHGEFHIKPDTAIVSVGVLNQAPTAAGALAANTKSMQSVFAALNAAEIENQDIQTSNFSVQPHYDYNNGEQPPVLTGYDVINNVNVIVRKLDTLGSVLDKVVSAGSNQISGITFEVSKPNEATDEARRLAVADALHKARVLAKASNAGLGRVAIISESTATQPPIVRMAKSLGAERAADVPVAEGQETITVDISMTWELR